MLNFSALKKNAKKAFENVPSSSLCSSEMFLCKFFNSFIYFFRISAHKHTHTVPPLNKFPTSAIINLRPLLLLLHTQLLTVFFTPSSFILLSVLRFPTYTNFMLPNQKEINELYEEEIKMKIKSNNKLFRSHSSLHFSVGSLHKKLP